MFDYEGLNRFLNEKEATLLKCQLNTVDGQIVKDEYINTIHLIRTGAMLQYYIERRDRDGCRNREKYSVINKRILHKISG